MASGGAPSYPPLDPPPEKPTLWYWHHTYSSIYNDKEPAASQALIDQAVAAGYTGLAFWDSGMTFANRPGWDPSTTKAIVAYAVSKGLEVLPSVAPFGYSNDLLQTDPNLAEGRRVIGSQFTVKAGQLSFVNSLAPLVNGDFESGSTGWFSFGDAGASLSAGSGHGGGAAALLDKASNNERLTQALTLTPYRLYHLRFWLKTAGFSGGDAMLSVLDTSSASSPSLFDRELAPPTDQDFTQYDYTFNSGTATKALVYLGVWGGHEGQAWIDDISAEETALVNVLRRPGTPLSVYDPKTMTPFAEGTDVAMVVDPLVAMNRGTFDDYHAPPVIAVPAGSKLSDGQVVAVDSYSVFPAIDVGTGACLTEPAVHSWMHDNIAALAAEMPENCGFFLGYDEVRHMHSCELCRKQSDSAGGLLAWSVGRSASEIHAVRPDAPLYFWTDMFDPYHNAVDNYYYVEGNVAGSWQGLPPGAIMMNWNLGKLAQSLAWFAGTDPSGMQPHGFRQIIAGYYSNGDGGAEATKELGAATGVPGVIGAMYTVWDDNYTQLQAYADAMRAGWAAYRSSVPAH